jgi:hypothetical protein
MPEIESDPSQSTEMFRAFVDRGAADQGSYEPAPAERRVPTALIAGIVVVAVVLAVAIFLVL